MFLIDECAWPAPVLRCLHALGSSFSGASAVSDPSFVLPKLNFTKVWGIDSIQMQSCLSCSMRTWLISGLQEEQNTAINLHHPTAYVLKATGRKHLLIDLGSVKETSSCSVCRITNLLQPTTCLQQTAEGNTQSLYDFMTCLLELWSPSWSCEVQGVNLFSICRVR